MAIATSDIIGILKDNLELRKSVIPIPTSKATEWTKGLNIPKGGETVIYTGFMYQLVPYINATVKYVEKYGDSPLTKFSGIGRTINKLLSLTSFMRLFSKIEEAEYNEILRSITALLRKAEVEFGYLYGDELYTGALLYDLGVDKTFEKHARLVYENLKKHGVKKIITVDPHTTNMFRSVYPKFIPEFDIETKSYLEILAENIDKLQPVYEKWINVVIHDPCVYARYEGIIEEPRILLKKAGYKIIEPVNHGKYTFCCGGPIESVYPMKSLKIGQKRLNELKEFGINIVTLCPICLANLRRASNGLRIDDIAIYLKEAFLV